MACSDAIDHEFIGDLSENTNDLKKGHHNRRWQCHLPVRLL